MAGEHEPVASVVPFAAQDHDRSGRTPRQGDEVGIVPQERFGDAASGVLHEDDAGQPDQLAGELVEPTDLGSREDDGHRVGR
jgi:hypothetical protein